jgi:tetratricopeptide (TPR) repeat protein
MPSIDPQRWAALMPHLDHALELPEDERGEWLASLASSRPEIAAELTRLFARYRVLEADRFLERDALQPDSPTLCGQTIGAYTLTAQIGHGGMGSVWLAERSDGRFERQAAIKLLNIALAGRGEARFKQEGTLLGRLSHPHIAQLVDAGVAPSGQPYLVLEHVAGEPITGYCDRRSLDLRSRVALFLDVLTAVAHAHANLIVHRDIKPSNVLVTDAGQVKLLDFGIAKLLEDERGTSPRTQLTAEGAAGLTLEFAAPEQVSGGPISTATDVYSLAVLFFVLLTGRHPAENVLQSPVDLIKSIVDLDAPRPSDVVSDGRTRRQLRGDLDTIVGKALKKNPSERYASVTAMAEDLRRHLAHEPITARRDSLGYRATTFVRRHRWPVAAAVVVFTLLAGGLVMVNRQRRIAEDRFRQLRQLSQQVFALDVRIANLAGATDARKALVAASLEYLEGLSRDAGDDLDLMQEVAEGYWRVARIQGVPTGLNLGDFAKAEESLGRADTLIDRVVAARPGDPRALERSGLIAHDRMIVADSERRDADALLHLRKAIVRADALLATGRATDLQQGSAVVIYGDSATASGNMHRYDEAARYARRHLVLARGLGNPQNTSVALSTLANALRSQGDLEGALTAIREARAIADRTTYASETKRMFDRYALLLREGFILGDERTVSLARPEEAAASLREAFAMLEAGARRDPSDYTSRTRIGTSGRELGNILRWDKPAEALAVYDTALGRLREIKNNVKARRDTAVILAGSSYALRRLNRAGEAGQRLDEATAILRETKDYPAERLVLDSEAYTVLKAVADHHADVGQLALATQEHESLRDQVLAAGPDLENDLRDTNQLSLLLDDLARLHRKAGASDQAAAIEARRLALWQHWNQKLPNNPFVLRRLAAGSPQVAGLSSK